MKLFTARVSWQRTGPASPEGSYPSGHVWEFDGGARVLASAAPQSMPAPYSVAEHVDPEEAFVAAAASCHMLFFLFSSSSSPKERGTSSKNTAMPPKATWIAMKTAGWP